MAASGRPFGQHYRGLTRRRQAAGVPALSQAPDGARHVHARLWVYTRGRRVQVPPGVGLDPTKPEGMTAALHTHDASGTIHVEGISRVTLGQLFSVWGVALSAHQLGPYRARNGERVRIWVDGRRYQAAGRLRLVDGQRIVVSLNVSGAPAPPTPN